MAEGVMPEDVQEIQQVVSRYHQALTDADAEASLQCLGDTYFRFGRRIEGSADDLTRWGAAGFGTREDMRQWLSGGGTYTNTIEFLHTDVQENAAVVVTKETGSSSSGERSFSWEGVTNLWCVAQVEGTWRIVGSAHHIAGKGTMG